MKQYTVLRNTFPVKRLTSLEDAEIFAYDHIKYLIFTSQYLFEDENKTEIINLFSVLKENDPETFIIWNIMFPHLFISIDEQEVIASYKPSKKINDNFNKFLAERLLEI
jgi:hypothetical protein